MIDKYRYHRIQQSRDDRMDVPEVFFELDVESLASTLSLTKYRLWARVEHSMTVLFVLKLDEVAKK